MTVNVYWTRSNPGLEDLARVGFGQDAMISSMRIPEPVPLLKHMDYQEFFGPLVVRCPAIVDDLKNIFVIKSPVDLKLHISMNKFSIKVANQEMNFAKAFLGESQGKFGIHQLGMGYLFFSESSLIATQLPAYYDVNSFTTNTFTISASFDIGQWYRPSAKPAFIFKPGTTEIDIKEGDPLLYIKFNTQEKVKLIEFDDIEFKRLGEQSPEFLCGNLKKHSSFTISLSKCYEYFNQYKMRRRILKLIKKNIV
jgi:hypothetical protein